MIWERGVGSKSTNQTRIRAYTARTEKRRGGHCVIWFRRRPGRGSAAQSTFHCICMSLSSQSANKTNNEQQQQKASKEPRDASPPYAPSCKVLGRVAKTHPREHFVGRMSLVSFFGVASFSDFDSRGAGGRGGVTLFASIPPPGVRPTQQRRRHPGTRNRD